MIPTDFHRFLEGGTTNQHRLDHLKMEAIGSPKNVRNPEGNHPRRSLQRYTYIYTHTYIYIYIMNYIDISMIWMKSFSFCSVAWL